MTLLQWGIDFAFLAAGVGIGYLLGLRHNKRLDKIDPEHAPHKTNKASIKNVLGIILVIMSVFIVISTAQTNDQTKALADQRAKDAEAQGLCNDEFFRVLQERTKITADDNALNRQDAAALQDLVQQLLAVPPPVTTSPAATFDALKKYQDTINYNNEKRAQNDRERAEKPYPEPRCGQ